MFFYLSTTYFVFHIGELSLEPAPESVFLQDFRCTHQPSDQHQRPRGSIAPLPRSPEKQTASLHSLHFRRYRHAKSRHFCAPDRTPFENGATYEVTTNDIRKRSSTRICAHRSRTARRATRGATTASISYFRFERRRTSPDPERSQKLSRPIRSTLEPQTRRQFDLKHFRPSKLIGDAHFRSPWHAETATSRFFINDSLPVDASSTTAGQQKRLPHSVFRTLWSRFSKRLSKRHCIEGQHRTASKPRPLDFPRNSTQFRGVTKPTGIILQQAGSCSSNTASTTNKTFGPANIAPAEFTGNKEDICSGTTVPVIR